MASAGSSDARTQPAWRSSAARAGEDAAARRDAAGVVGGGREAPRQICRRQRGAGGSGAGTPKFLDNAHIQTACTRAQFAAEAGNGAHCPPASVYGHATAITPLLDQPLSGPVYLRSSNHKLPDLVAALNGQIDVVLDGRVDTGKGGGLRNTFEAVPDAPVSKFVLNTQGGSKGLLVNSTNLCTASSKELQATVNLTGQNGKTYDTIPVVANSCGSKGAKKKRGRR